ncbi:MOSC domain-containing protein [Nocardioides mangrovicus]|uniref:MOSC domain-containing protein n=2 Tax=Nocardioides mangrovicus TaxID=2478913 RepID=A0A3L8P304_9ACTN|nr:MOSC domain-containing protein [Nocardioides mangrovicus]
MKAVDEVVVETGHGITGDRYENARHRQVTVQSADGLAAAAVDLGLEVKPAGTRRNITIDHGQVPTTPGARVRIGEVELEVVRVAAPCRILDDEIAPGAAAALRRRAGTVFRTVRGGTVRIGDEVSL